MLTRCKHDIGTLADKSITSRIDADLRQVTYYKGMLKSDMCCRHSTHIGRFNILLWTVMTLLVNLHAHFKQTTTHVVFGDHEQNVYNQFIHNRKTCKYAYIE